MKWSLLVIAFFFINTSCVDPLDFDVPNEENYLVVDGYITTEEGPHIVALSMSDSYDANNINSIPKLISDANVKIYYGIENEIELISIGDGKYSTPENFKGVIGESYQLEVVLNNNQKYLSSSETILDTAIINDFYYEFVEKLILNSDNNVSSEIGLSYYADYEFPTYDDITLMWDWEGTYIFRTEFHTRSLPLNCYVNETVEEYVKVSNNEGTTKLNIVKDEVLFEPVDYRYRYRYSKNIKLYTLSEGVAGFYNLMASQIDQDGSIFSPTPATITGNITSQDDSKEPVLGFFGAFSVVNKRIFINGSSLPVQQTDSVFNRGDYSECKGNPNYVPDYCYDCRNHVNSSETPPSFWE